jgi:hypothetical protein
MNDVESLPEKIGYRERANGRRPKPVGAAQEGLEVSPASAAKPRDFVYAFHRQENG